VSGAGFFANNEKLLAAPTNEVDAGTAGGISTPASVTMERRPDLPWECDMQCLMQVFDSDGKPRLNGGSRFKYHINWLALSGWSNGASSSNYSASASRTPQLQEIRFVLRADHPIVPVLFDAAKGNYDSASWSKATLDCFKDGDDFAWTIRITFQDPAITSIRQSGTADDLTPFMEVGLGFTRSSIDYRDPDSKVSYFMPTDAIFDPDQQVCRVFDPDNAVSRLPE
jgi:type VI protein secretion system component Hcp